MNAAGFWSGLTAAVLVLYLLHLLSAALPGLAP